MRAPDPGVPLYWCCGGDVVRRHAEHGAEPVDPEAADALLGFHHAESARVRGVALAFHQARARELAAALSARDRWRRAARVA
ncbi:MAG TPA: hypothetical protein VKU90_14410 [Caulobacteraceae bacterium]|nr:hypothetical protein [Caulobacteraceae bacterium]